MGLADKKGGAPVELLLFGSWSRSGVVMGPDWTFVCACRLTVGLWL